MRLLGIYREHEYSPGRHRSNDAWLLESVADALRVEGFDVELTTLDRAAARHDGTSLVFSMCQGRASLEALLEWESDGTPIVNSPRAALNTHRDRLASLMIDGGVPFPETVLIETSAAARSRGVALGALDAPMWLKRGDVHASIASDVQRIDTAAALESGLAGFEARGIARAAVQAHRAGDELKFYGVAEESFFHWFYPREAHGYRFDAAQLVRIAEQAAAIAGLDIFGGDVIVSPEGALTLIDLNDWPSFAPCRDAAAGAIAGYITRRVHAHRNPDVRARAKQGAL